MTKRVLAFDPGVRTGVACLSATNYVHEVRASRLCPREQVDVYYAGIASTYNDLLLYLPAFEPKVVLIETFTSGMVAHKPQLHTIKMIGAIEMLCTMKGFAYRLVTSSQKTGYLERAKKLLADKEFEGVQYLACDKEHVIDATAHALRYLEKGK